MSCLRFSDINCARRSFILSKKLPSLLNRSFVLSKSYDSYHYIIVEPRRRKLPREPPAAAAAMLKPKGLRRTQSLTSLPLLLAAEQSESGDRQRCI